MNRLDYYFRQLLSEAELDLGFTYAEQALWNFAIDHGLKGLISGLGVAAQGSPNMTVAVANGVAYMPAGQRVAVPTTQAVNCAVDYNNTSTAVSTVGKEKWLSVFLLFERSNSDPRTDGNSQTVYFERAESYQFKVVQGAEANTGTATRPSLDPDGRLLADIKLIYNQTSITNSDISTLRTEKQFKTSGSPNSIAGGALGDVMSELLGFINAHITDTTDAHAATAISYGGGGTWADGTTNPATTVEAQLDRVVSLLAAKPTDDTDNGANKVGMTKLAGTLVFSDVNASADWVAGSVYDQLVRARSAINSHIQANNAASYGWNHESADIDFDALTAPTPTNGVITDVANISSGGSVRDAFNYALGKVSDIAHLLSNNATMRVTPTSVAASGAVTPSVGVWTVVPNLSIDVTAYSDDFLFFMYSVWANDGGNAANAIAEAIIRVTFPDTSTADIPISQTRKYFATETGTSANAENYAQLHNIAYLTGGGQTGTHNIKVMVRAPAGSPAIQFAGNPDIGSFLTVFAFNKARKA